MGTRRIILAAVIALAALPTAPAASAFAAPAASHPISSIKQYRAVDLGVRGTARAVNDRGQAVGEGSFPSGGVRPFLWNHGKAIDLGVLPGGSYGMTTDINNRGQVVGLSTTVDERTGTSFEHAVLWDRGRITDLGTLGSGWSVATSINDRGQIVGYGATTIGGTLHGLLWDHGTMTVLPMHDAADINDRGQVVGQADFGTGSMHACLWRHGQLINLDTGAHPWSRAVAINDRGWVTGDTQWSTPAHAFLWRDGAVVDLGTLGGNHISVMDINARGQILGMGSIQGQGPIHTFIWERGGMVDLTRHGMPDNSDTYDIYGFNNHADIAGSVLTDDIHAVVFK